MKTESKTTTPETDTLTGQWIACETVPASHARNLELERNEAQAKLKEAQGAMNDAMWQLMRFLKPNDEKTLGIIKKLEDFIK